MLPIYPHWKDTPSNMLSYLIGSCSAVHAATVHAWVLSGSYRSDARLAKWTGESESCSLPGCGSMKGDIQHLLSGECPALQPKLAQALSNGLAFLEPYPYLHEQAVLSLQGPPEQWLYFLLDPSTDEKLIQYKQEYGVKSLNPVFRFSRTLIWTMHRERLRLKRLRHYLLH